MLSSLKVPPPSGRSISFLPVLIILLPLRLFSQSGLVRIHEDFSKDPLWDNWQNRITCEDCPTVVQDFGWSPTAHASSLPGEIGGRIENSFNQAYYAMPLGRPLTFDDEISASGKLAIRHLGRRATGYFGFFNSRRHTWRVWSSIAIRIWESDGLGQVMFDWMAGDWHADRVETAILLPADGSAHRWRFKYEPDFKVDPVWRDTLLEKHITDRTGRSGSMALQGEDAIYKRVRKELPGIGKEELHARLIRLRDQGLIEYFYRHGNRRWWKRPHPGDSRGRFTLQFDDEEPYVFYMTETVRGAPVEMDRFGLFNMKVYGAWIELYLSDLTVNGHAFDFSQDPRWEGRQNRVSYTEPYFHSMHDFGFSQTNWAGEAPGEIGGVFWRTETADPRAAYYADDVGQLTLDDPISFSGSIYFENGMTDAAMYFGYFNSEEQKTTRPTGKSEGYPRPHSMGLVVSDRTRVGWYFQCLLSPADRRLSAIKKLTTYTPSDGQSHFTFKYDPEANEGVGRITFSLDDRETTLDLTPEERASGAVFDRFGLANIRRGGKAVTVYLDDLSYTGRRPEGYQPLRRKQEVISAPYPPGGRRF